MNYWQKMSSGIGRMLVLSIGVILFLTVLSVYVSTVAIDKIDVSQRNLTSNSIPALIDVNHLSRVAVNIIKQSQLMSIETSQDKLNISMDSTSILIESLLDYLEKIKSYGFPGEFIAEVESILVLLNENVIELHQLALKKLEYEKKLIIKINMMRSSIETIEDKISLMKVNADNKFLNDINNIEGYDANSVKKLFHKEINDIELVSNVIVRIGELRKDLNAINQTVSSESILFVQQEFNHSLRKIVRSIVQNKNLNFHKDVRDNISLLIEYGQDSPDIFDDRKTVISMVKRLEMIAQENIVYTQQLNAAVLSLANQVRMNAESASNKLDAIIAKSRSVLYFIVITALVVSLLIAWKFIYKRIVVKLAELSTITKKLSNNQFNFDVNTNGDDELSDIANALESLREHSLKRISLNKALETQSLRLKQSNEDLSQFAYIASHDLQEPLRMVSSYVQLIKNRYKEELDNTADTYIDFAVDGCVRMKALIEGLLEYSRVESNKEDLEDIDSNLLLNEVIQDLSVQIKEKNAEIVFDTLHDIYAIPSQVRMIFSNMIGNGLKYCVHDIPRIKIQSVIQAGKVKFSVSDNGIGIKPRYQQQIFVIFKRLHSRAEYSGTGIGLSICKKIIESQGGEITLESEFGAGTTFYFTLPVSLSESSIDEHRIAV